MNAGPADTRSPHLDLADLIAEVTGQAIADPAREHLARCEHCRAEVNRWDLVAGGVRGLAAATPEAAQPARPRHTRPRVLAGPRRRTVLAASAAAALVLLAAVGYGATTALTQARARRHGPHRGQRVRRAQGGRRDAGAGERHQPGHQNGQRPAGDRDHDGVHVREHVRTTAERHHRRGASRRDVHAPARGRRGVVLGAAASPAGNRSGSGCGFPRGGGPGRLPPPPRQWAGAGARPRTDQCPGVLSRPASARPSGC